MTSTSAIRDKKFIILMAVLSLDASEVVIVNFQQNQRQKLCQKWWHFLFRNDSWQYPDSKSHGANMGHHLGPTGPRWAPWTLLSGYMPYIKIATSYIGTWQYSSLSCLLLCRKIWAFLWCLRGRHMINCFRSNEKLPVPHGDLLPYYG